MSSLPNLLGRLEGGEMEVERVAQQIQCAPDLLRHNYFRASSTRAITRQHEACLLIPECPVVHVGKLEKFDQCDLQIRNELGGHSDDPRFSTIDYCSGSTAANEDSKHAFQAFRCAHSVNEFGIPSNCLWKNCCLDRDRPVLSGRPDILHHSVLNTDLRSQLTLSGGDGYQLPMCQCPRCQVVTHVLATETAQGELPYPRMFSSGMESGPVFSYSKPGQCCLPMDSSPVIGTYLSDEVCTRRDIYMSRFSMREGCDGNTSEFDQHEDIGVDYMEDCSSMIPTHCESAPCGIPQVLPTNGLANTSNLQSPMCTCRPDCDYPVNFCSGGSSLLLPKVEHQGQHSIESTPNHEVDREEMKTCSLDRDQRVQEVEELNVFAQSFKHRRMKLGITQAEVGSSLGNLDTYAFGSLSQSTICRFESLSLSHNNMLILKPILQTWLRKTEKLGKIPDRSVRGSLNITQGQLEAKTRRTSITDTEKRVLEAFFNSQPKPSGGELCKIANRVQLKKGVVRVWFCNQRQKQKRIQFSQRSPKPCPPKHLATNTFIPHLSPCQ